MKRTLKRAMLRKAKRTNQTNVSSDGKWFCTSDCIGEARLAQEALWSVKHSITVSSREIRASELPVHIYPKTVVIKLEADLQQYTNAIGSHSASVPITDITPAQLCLIGLRQYRSCSTDGSIFNYLTIL